MNIEIINKTRAAIEPAVKKAIEEVGLETFKKTSLFMSNKK